MHISTIKPINDVKMAPMLKKSESKVKKCFFVGGQYSEPTMLVRLTSPAMLKLSKRNPEITMKV